jgi:hypothetical protein
MKPGGMNGKKERKKESRKEEIVSSPGELPVPPKF